MIIRYDINEEDLYSKIEEEVSMVASRAYGENGEPLYDGISLKSRNKPEIYRAIEDAVIALVKRLRVVAVYHDEAQGPRAKIRRAIAFHLPDVESGHETITKDEITRYVVLSACAAWFQESYPDKVEEYSGRSVVSLDKVVSLALTRKPLTQRIQNL